MKSITLQTPWSGVLTLTTRWGLGWNVNKADSGGLGPSSAVFPNRIEVGGTIAEITGLDEGEVIASVTPSDMFAVSVNGLSIILAQGSFDAGVYTAQYVTSEGRAASIIVNLVQGGGEVPTRLLQVATRSYTPDFFAVGAKQARSRSAHYARSAISKPLIGFPHWWVDSFATASKLYTERAPGAVCTVTASIEYPEGSYTQLTFGGLTSGTIPDGGMLTADRPNISIPKGAKFMVRVYRTCTAGLPYNLAIGSTLPGSISFGDAFDGGASGITDNTMNGDPYAANGSSALYTPIIIADDTTEKAFMLIGDSRVHGEGDTHNGTGDVGELARSIGATHAYTNCGIRGDGAFEFLASNSRRLALLPYFSTAIVEYGINDMIRGRTASQLAADTIAVGNLLSGVKAYITTFTPRSTGSFSTVTSQTTAAFNPDRVTENERRRSSPAPYFGCIDVTSSVESSLNSGKWAVSPQLTNDGTHENQVGYLAVQSSGVINPANL